MPCQFIFFLAHGPVFFTTEPDWDCRAEAHLYAGASRIGNHRNTLLFYNITVSINTVFSRNPTTESPTEILDPDPCCEERGMVPL